MTVRWRHASGADCLSLPLPVKAIVAKFSLESELQFSREKNIGSSSSVVVVVIGDKCPDFWSFFGVSKKIGADRKSSFSTKQMKNVPKVVPQIGLKWSGRVSSSGFAASCYERAGLLTLNPGCRFSSKVQRTHTLDSQYRNIRYFNESFVCSWYLVTAKIRYKLKRGILSQRVVVFVTHD